MNGFLVPANAKKGTLIFNLFRPFDITLFGSGIGLTILLLIIFQNSTTNIIFTIIAIIPVSITGLLVFPVPNYHNVLCALISIYNFYTKRRKYVWKGWCFNEQFANEEQSKK